MPETSDNLALDTDRYPVTSPDDLRTLQIVEINRSSTNENDHGAPLDHQSEEQRKALERYEYDKQIVRSYEEVESAATLDRESLNDALRAIRNDEANVLSAMAIDRLTRAHPFEANSFWKELAEAGGLLFTSTLGFIEWDDPLDIQQLFQQTTFAWKWYLRIKNGTAGAYEQALEDGEYFQPTPWGFEKDSDNKLRVSERKRPYVRQMFEIMKEEENLAEVYRQINNRLDTNNDLDLLDEDKDELSYNRIKTILTSQLCLGNLTYKDTVVNSQSELQIVDYETFSDVQKIIENRSTTQDSSPDLPESIGRAGARYGVEYVLSLLDSFPCECRKCGEKLAPYGSTEVKGILLQNYQCTDCDHQGPLLTEDEIDKLHQNHPLRCPFCTNTEGFDVTRGDRGRYVYKCKLCSKQFRCDHPPDKLERALENPDTMFRFNRKYEPTTIGTADSVSNGEDSKQQSLSEWAEP